jgi:alginate O-acetyltransferase complex protein AlgJ
MTTAIANTNRSTTDPTPTIRHADFVIGTDAPRPFPKPCPTPAQRIRRWADFSVVFVFVLGLAVVWFGTLFREQPPLNENRDRHPFPPLAAKKHVIQDFPKWFEMYFGDRIGYRDVLLSWNHAVLYELLNDPVTPLGWIGHAGWLFLNVDDPLRGLPNTPTVDDRLIVWADALAQRHAVLAARGIRYLVLIPPDKSSVYPEHLRGYVARHPPPSPGKRLAELLAERGVPCVDPLPSLLKHKAENPHKLYYQRDSHWTEDGAHVAYRLLAQELGLTSPTPMDEYEIIQSTFAGDLGRLVGMAESDWGEPERKWIVRDRIVNRDDAPIWAAGLPAAAKPRHLLPRVYSCERATGPSVVLFRDSFGDQLLPYLAADCRRLAVVSSDRIEMNVVDAVQPEVVVQEMIGRKLYQITPQYADGLR